MADKDILEKQLTSSCTLAADLISVLFTHAYGDHINPEDLTLIPVHAAVSDQKRTREIERDVLFLWKEPTGEKIAYFGIENQSSYQRLMAARAFGYNGATVIQQLAQKRAAGRRRQKNPHLAFGEEEDIVPVFTLVLYTSPAAPWPENPSLAKSFKVRREWMNELLNDSTVRIIDVGSLADEVIAEMNSDYKYVAMYVKALREHKPLNLDDTIKADDPYLLMRLLMQISSSTLSEEQLQKLFEDEERTVNDMITLLTNEEKQKIRDQTWKEATQAAWKEATEVTRQKSTALISWLYNQGRLEEVEQLV